MAVVTMLVGPSRRRKKVECVHVARGLVAHPPPDVDKGDGLLNITHASSGLAVIQHLPEDKLPDAIDKLNQLNWEIPEEDIFASPPHFECVSEVCFMANRETSDRQEEKLAKDLGGRRNLRSGAMWGYRRDIVTKDYLIEAKDTDKKRYLISLKDFGYLAAQAYERGKTPVYAVSVLNRPEVIVCYHDDLFDDSDGSAHPEVQNIDLKKRKSLPVDTAVADYVNSGGRIVYTLSEKRYVVLGYESFLDEVKLGVNS